MKKQSESLHCGECQQWQETTVRCPGWGHCSHPRAHATELPSHTPVSAQLLPASRLCLIPR